MGAIGDIFEITDVQEMLGQEVLNVYFYRARTITVSDNNAQSMVNAFIEHVLPVITVVQSSDVVHTAVRGRNLFDASDAYEALISEAGAADGVSSGTFEAYPFRLVGDNAAVRSGAKRIGGVEQASTSDGVVTGAPLLSALNDLAEQFATEIAWGLLEAAFGTPVVVARLLVDGNYVLPDNSGDAVYSAITDALFNPRVTSQVSRKVGVGE